MSILAFRPLRPSDVPAAVALLRAEGARGALLEAALLARLLAERRLIARAFEQTETDGRIVLRGCGLSALLEPEPAERAARGGVGDLVETALASCRGAAPWLLDRPRVALLNRARRLHMLILDFAVDTSPGAPVQAVTALAHTAFVQAHGGYNLRSLIGVVRPWERKAEAYRASLLSMGCRPVPAAADGTQVLVLDAEEIARQPFHLLQPLFLHREPRLALTPAQQDLLELACLGFDDEAIAAQLHVSLHTVHKRWRAIYARAADALPALVSAAAGGTAKGVRGGEKRKRLVEFARAHPEELRPWPAPRAAPAQSHTAKRGRPAANRG